MIEQEDEILALQIERANAKAKMAEAWHTLTELRKATKQYEEFHLRWSKRHSAADLKLAELDGRMKKVVTSTQATKLPTSIALHLTKDQVIEIAGKLGAEIKFEDEEEKNDLNRESS